MPTYFVIEKLNGGYTWKDFEMCDLAYDYVVDELNVPEESIDFVDVSLDTKRVEVTLFDDKDIAQEDWYYCLLKYSA